jgi:hypothetical protein
MGFQASVRGYGPDPHTGGAEDLLPGEDPNQEKRAPADILLAGLTHEVGNHLTTLMIYTSADVRKVGKDG